MRRGVYLLPSLFTTGNALCGFYAIIASINGIIMEVTGNHDSYGKWLVEAAYVILLGGVFDALDGRVARSTKTTSRFGIEYDSLADLLTFGVAPAILLYVWALRPYGKVGWVASFLFVICGALRLARFNAQATGAKGKYFTGLPTPGAAAIVSSLVIFYFSYWKSFEGFFHYRGIISVIIGYAVALLMVSTIKFRSFSGFDMTRRKQFSVLVGSILFIFIIIMKPRVMLLLIIWGCFSFAFAEGLYLFFREKFAVKEEEKGALPFGEKRKIYVRRSRKKDNYGTDKNI